MTEADLPILLALCRSNPGYYEHCPPFVTEESLRADLAALPAEEETALPAPGDTVVLLISNSIFNKGTDRAIVSLGALPEDLKQTIRLWIVGKIKPGEIQPLIDAAGLSARTNFLGQTDGVSACMFGADLFLHPARNESAGATLIEALAAGLPVITTDICGFAPYVREATETVLEEPFQQEKLTAMVGEVIPRLDELKRRTLAYAEQQDFCSRAKVFADILEKS